MLIELFSKIGEKSFQELNGIFAFIIFDKLKNKLICVRDRMGVKPLYYFKNNNNYYFCSEIKGILSIFQNLKINFKAVNFYLQNSFYDYSRQTFFKDIFQLNQGSYMIFDLENNTVIEKKILGVERREKIK